LKLEGSQWSASRPGRFAPRERAPDTDCNGGRVVRPAPTDSRKPDHPGQSPALYFPTIPAHKNISGKKRITNTIYKIISVGF